MWVLLFLFTLQGYNDSDEDTTVYKGEFKLCFTFSYERERERDREGRREMEDFHWLAQPPCIQGMKNTVYVLINLRSYLENNLLDSSKLIGSSLISN